MLYILCMDLVHRHYHGYSSCSQSSIDFGARVEIIHDFGFTDKIPVRKGIEENLTSYSSAGWVFSKKRAR